MKALDLSSYLIIPMQRITRYSLLFRQILHYTGKEHPHHDATLVALQMCDSFVDKLNSSIREKQSLSKLVDLVNLLDLDIPDEVGKANISDIGLIWYSPQSLWDQDNFCTKAHFKRIRARGSCADTCLMIFY